MVSKPADLPSLHPTSGREPDQILRIAHRGGVDGPQPYRSANLQRIAALGAHLLEFDLQVTRDDKLVAAHDATMEKADSGSRRIAESSLDELMRSAPADVDLPEATTVVRVARDAGLGLYIDLKTLTPAAARWLVGILYEEGMSERTILASSDDAIVRTCADVAPDLPRAVLFGSPDADPIALATSTDANFVHPCWETLPNPHEQLSQGWLDRVRQHGIGIICWHEERRPVVEGLWSLGVDGVCTDEPELLTSVAQTLPGTLGPRTGI